MRSVCGEEEETGLNHLLQCDGCRSFVHMACYGVAAPPEGRNSNDFDPGQVFHQAAVDTFVQ